MGNWAQFAVALERGIFVLAAVVVSPFVHGAQPVRPAAVVFAGYLVVLEAGGRITAYTLSADAKPPAPWLRSLQIKNAAFIAVDGSELWVATRQELFSRKSQDPQWTARAALGRTDQDPRALVLVKGQPLVAYTEEVVNALTGQSYLVPAHKNHQLLHHWMKASVSLAAAGRAWFGSDNGEWGGELCCLDPVTREWGVFADTGLDVTGIASDEADHVMVAWSMNGGMSQALIRLHDPATAAVTREYPQQPEFYFYALSYNGFDHSLYGIADYSYDQLWHRLNQTRPIRKNGAFVAEFVNGIPRDICPAVLPSAEHQNQLPNGYPAPVSAVLAVGNRLEAVVPRVGPPFLVEATSASTRILVAAGVPIISAVPRSQ